MNRNLITQHVVFGVLVVCMFFGCKNRTVKFGSDISDNSEEQVDTLAELARNIGDYEIQYYGFYRFNYRRHHRWIYRQQINVRFKQRMLD